MHRPPVLVGSVPMDAIVTQHYRREQWLRIRCQIQHTNSQRDLVENVDPGEIVVHDAAQVLADFFLDQSRILRDFSESELLLIQVDILID